LKKQINKEKN